MTFLMRTSRFRAVHSLRWVGALALVLSAAACGGNDDGGTGSGGGAGSGAASGGGGGTPAITPTALSGTAAVGAPIVSGTVQVRCEGTSTVLSTVTSDTGTWQVDTTGQTLPCALRVTGGSLPAGQAYHSAAVTFGNTNITPLTDLMVANVVGRAPALWWGSNGPTELTALVQAKLDQSLTALRAGLGLDVLKSVDPLKASFNAQRKDKIDDVLESLRLALKQAGLEYAALVSAAASQDFAVSEGFRVELANSYVTITLNGTDGNSTLIVNVTASGVALPPVTIHNVPKPASHAEFCGWVNDPASNLSLNQLGNSPMGSLTINSCSFSGNVGQVSATVRITSPISMAVPYDVTYTYN